MNLERIYALNFLLLILHQIDAAFWKEWEMFFLPGGVQGFLLFNLLIFPFILVGYKTLILKAAHYRAYSYLCGAFALLVFLIHSGFALSGFEQFTLPFSMLIIALCGIFGPWQLWLTARVAAKTTAQK